MNIIQTKGAPAAIGPYSQGISTGKLLFTSGQLPVNPADGAMPEGIAAQAEWSCKNVGAILEAAGSGFEKVVKTTCFLADIADFAAFNEVYARYFTSKPARSCVAVKDLPKGALCEIEAFFELLDLQLVSVLLPQGDRHRYTAEDSGVQEVVWIAGVGHHDLIAWVNEGHHCKHQAGI